MTRTFATCALLRELYRCLLHLRLLIVDQDVPRARQRTLKSLRAPKRLWPRASTRRAAIVSDRGLRVGSAPFTNPWDRPLI